jgi:hypothetical protein
MINVPPGISTISNKTPFPKSSVKYFALALRRLMMFPVASVVTTSKLKVWGLLEV